jgi:hypothetical protein
MGVEARLSPLGSACSDWGLNEESENRGMLHRHLNHQEFTLAAIDNVIARGKRRDWAELRREVLSDRITMEKVLQVCQAHVADPYAQRYHFWKQYVERLLA